MRSRDYSNIALALTAFASVALIGYLCGIATIEKYGTQSWLDRWQTLVAGGLAVLAALITVAAMLWQDGMQQTRHEELMRLNLRADRLRARRAAIPHSEHLNSYADALVARVQAFEQAPEAGGQLHRESMGRVLNHRRIIVDILTGESIVAAKNMFGSEMAFTYQSLEKNLCDDAFGPFNISSKYVSQSTDISFEIISRNCQLTIARIKKSIPEVKAFADHLTKLAGHYGPD